MTTTPRIERQPLKETYGQLWDRYVSDAFPKLQKESAGELTYPGEEWGSQQSWDAIFDHLFVPSDVANWRYGVEIGGGGGKYTERVLAANDQVKVWGFDVSRNFLDATAKRLRKYIDDDRLSLFEIDGECPDALMRVFEKRSLVRKVDAMFSIDAMVHVDLQYLVTYWINAAQILKKGGRILMTLADPTSDAGFQKLTRDIAKFYKFQGRICPKFEYLSVPIVRYVLERLGFECELLQHWAQREGAAPRDIYLIAQLVDTAKADSFRGALRTKEQAEKLEGLGMSGPETYGEYWDRHATIALQNGLSTIEPSTLPLIKALLPVSDIHKWSNVVEIGGGDGRFADQIVRANSKLRLWRFDVSNNYLDAAQTRLKEHNAQVSSHLIDGTRPDTIYRVLKAESMIRKVDAIFSLDSLIHVDLQYSFAYWVNAALALKEGGQFIMQVADPTSDAGFAHLINDIVHFYPYQGRACNRLEYTSENVVRYLLNELGFEIDILQWGTFVASEPSRDIFVVAHLAHLDRAASFTSAITTGLIPMLTTDGNVKSQGDDGMPASITEERRNIARAIGLAYWRRLLMQSNPDMTREQMRQQMKESWGGSRREYTRFGLAVLKQLENMGYNISKTKAEV